MKLTAEIWKMMSRTLSVMALSAFVLTACDDAIYDDEGDCSHVYKVAFRYDMNMAYADALTHDVKSVTLYAFDNNGKFVKSFNNTIASMAMNNYMMDVDLDPGTYQFVAWGGLNDGLNSYTVTAMQPGVSTIQDLTNMVNRTHDAEGNAVVGEVNNLFYGATADTLPDEEGIHVVTVPLMKNTKRINVVLQSLSGKTLDVDKFRFSITSGNGKMNYDNSLMADEILTYEPYYLQEGTAEVYTRADGEEEVQQLGVVVAEMNTNRLVKDWPERTWLHISTVEGKNVLTIPLIDYLLLVKGKYNGGMSDQDFLDRQDNYSITFFLYDSNPGGDDDDDDDEDTWWSAEIIINSWKIVLQNADL